MDTITPPRELNDAALTEITFRQRILNRRTIVSLVVSLALLVFLLTRVQVDLDRTVQVILGANLWLYLAGLGVYYLIFPVRAVRWRKMLMNAGCRPDDLPRLSSLAGIIFLSWFVNCLVPAKLGDVYRAYLVKKASPISLTKAGGTIVAERIFDFAFVLVLVGVTGLLGFQGRMPDFLVSGLEIGTVLAVIAGSGLLIMWRWPSLIRFVLPSRLHALYERFEEGALGAFGSYPLLLGLTVSTWLIEAVRLFFVVRSLGLQVDDRLGVELAVLCFVALVSSLFTAPPGLPAGLGYVEASIVAAFMLLGQPLDTAISVAVLDRSISYLSLVVFGAIFYLISRPHRP